MKGFSPYLLALVWAAVAIGFQVSELMHHAAWQGGTETVMGHVDQVVEGKRLTQAFYSYEVDGHTYKGEEDGPEGLIEGTPEMVTYAKSDPSISTLQPSDLGRRYVTCVVITVLGILPLVILILWNLKKRFMPKRAPNATQ